MAILTCGAVSISQAPRGADPEGRKLECLACQRGQVLCWPPSSLSGQAWGRSQWGWQRCTQRGTGARFPQVEVGFQGQLLLRRALFGVWGTGGLSDEGQESWVLVAW